MRADIIKHEKNVGFVVFEKSIEPKELLSDTDKAKIEKAILSHFKHKKPFDHFPMPFVQIEATNEDKTYKGIVYQPKFAAQHASGYEYSHFWMDLDGNIYAELIDENFELLHLKIN